MAGSNEQYLVQLGIDATTLLSGVGASTEQLTLLSQTANQTRSGLQNAFNGGAAASQTLSEQLRVNQQQIVALTASGREFGTTLAQAIKSGNTADVAQRLNSLRTQLTEITRTSRGAQISFDISQLSQVQEIVGGTTRGVEQLNQVLVTAREQLALLDPNSEEFTRMSQAIAVTEGALTGLTEALAQDTQNAFNLGATFEQVYGELQPLSARLGETEDRLYEMALAGQTNTEEFRQLTQQAIRFRQTIQQVDASVDTFARTSATLDVVLESAQALAGGFAAVQGAMALFGSENEELQKALLKVNAAMAILQGIQQVAAVLNKDSALSALLLSRAQTQATVSTAALTVATEGEAVAAGEAAVATNGLTAALLANPITAIAVAIAAVVAALILWGSSADDAEEELSKLNDTIERQNFLISLNDDAVKRGADIATAYAKLAGKSEKDLAAIEKDALQERINQREAFIKQNQEALDKINVSDKKSAEEYQKINDGITKAMSEVQNLKTEIQVNELNAQTEANKKAEELRKKGIEDAKKAVEEQKKINDQIVKYTQQAATSRIAALEDGYAKERRSIIQDYANKIQDIQNDKALSVAGEQAQTEAIEALRTERNKKLADLGKKQTKEQVEIQLAAQQQLAEAQKEGAKKDLDLLDVEYATKKNAINEQFKDEESLRIQLLTALEENTTARRKALQLKGKQDQLETEEAKELALIDLAKAYSLDNTDVEEKKQIAILQVKLDYAKKNLDALTASGKAENDVAVLQAKAQVANLQKELNSAVDANKGKGTSILDLLGISDDLTDSQLKGLQEAGKQVIDSVKTITDSLSSIYDSAINKKKEQIQATEDEISTLEDQLDKEKDLQDKGLANNVDTIQKELDAKQKQKDEEVKQEEELLKRQTALKKAQIIIDTATQASNLITASTEIFSALAGIPFVGVPLAIATIAVMLGAFAAAKVSAFKAVDDAASSTSFGDGGMIDGPSHENDGVRYKAMDGSNRIVEVEGGEYVVNKESTRKYRNIIEAINQDNLNATDFLTLAIEELLSGTGAHLMTETQDKAADVSASVDKMQVTINAHVQQNTGNEEIAGLLREILKGQQAAPKMWEDDNARYVKKGNKTIIYEKTES
jgi:hypothetical protein